MVQPSAVTRTPDSVYAERNREPHDTGVIDIGEYLVVLWRRRVAIAIVACLSAAVMLLVGLRQGRVYEAEATLAVSRPKLEGASDPTAVANFLPYLTARATASQVIKEFGLEKPPYDMSVSTFFGKVVTVEEVRNSTIIVVKAVVGDPELAARVANRVAELAVETGRRAAQKEALQIRDDIKLQLDESRQRMDAADLRVRTFRDQSQLEVLRKDVDAALDQRGGLLFLTIRIETERAKLQKAESELASRQRIDTVTRTIDSEPALMEAARSAGTQPGATGLQLKTELMNPVFMALDQQVASSRADLASMEKERAQVMSKHLGEPRMRVLTQLYAAEAELSRLEMERDLSRKVYETVATSYETARLSVAGRSSALQVVGLASPADRPLPRGALRSAAIAFMAGLILAALAAVLHHALSTLSKRAAA